ncbi:uncharacterized protein LOC126908381 [Daktulosphaira vitifoliae]|uniref:uncharacterized protein LOC126908381 n=1 Tax=Daktulosphaira vitifoliae TaxID=58002 RepID=UPI0021AAC85A|nr:uncharacterized protein LOC126908381 [Daktulosphaira vitifoliae]
MYKSFNNYTSYFQLFIYFETNNMNFKIIAIFNLTCLFKGSMSMGINDKQNNLCKSQFNKKVNQQNIDEFTKSLNIKDTFYLNTNDSIGTQMQDLLIFLSQQNKLYDDDKTVTLSQEEVIFFINTLNYYSEKKNGIFQRKDLNNFIQGFTNDDSVKYLRLKKFIGCLLYVELISKKFLPLNTAQVFSQIFTILIAYS